MSEDVRLIYVAVTRARNALMLGVAPLKSGNVKIPQLEKSAFGYLLNGGNKFASAAEVWTALAELQGDCPHLRIQPAPAPTATWFTPPPTAQLEAARVANFSLPSRWWIASYSALKTITAAEPETPLQNRVLEEAELERLSIAPQESFASELRQLHDFPRGTRSGTFLHGILEWAAECETRDADGQLLFGFAAAAASAPARLEMLKNRCALNGLTEWIVPLEQWLGAFLNQTWSLEIPPAPLFQRERNPPCPPFTKGEKEKPPFSKGGLGDLMKQVSWGDLHCAISRQMLFKLKWNFGLKVMALKRPRSIN
ncbi:hypothetical protein [Chromatium okenii]|uniref:Uncharacterized protein n=1 Tax=Chromatium okenii TaxID=61644 RepID=A0A2S7XNZ6_9GAMM|nr:hypothetical protein [Chromatium okenii]PQJ95459.1 hypothetical protein CXB77_14790 [Chromatium okenii]